MSQRRDITIGEITIRTTLLVWGTLKDEDYLRKEKYLCQSLNYLPFASPLIYGSYLRLIAFSSWLQVLFLELALLSLHYFFQPLLHMDRGLITISWPLAQQYYSKALE